MVKEESDCPCWDGNLALHFVTSGLGSVAGILLTLTWIGLQLASVTFSAEYLKDEEHDQTIMGLNGANLGMAMVWYLVSVAGLLSLNLNRFKSPSETSTSKAMASYYYQTKHHLLHLIISLTCIILLAVGVAFLKNATESGTTNNNDTPNQATSWLVSLRRGSANSNDVICTDCYLSSASADTSCNGSASVDWDRVCANLLFILANALGLGLNFAHLLSFFKDNRRSTEEEDSSARKNLLSREKAVNIADDADSAEIGPKSN